MRFISFCISGYQFYCTILSTASSISIVFSIYKKRPNFFNFCLFSLALLLFYSCTQSLLKISRVYTFSFTSSRLALISFVYFFTYFVTSGLVPTKLISPPDVKIETTFFRENFSTPYHAITLKSSAKKRTSDFSEVPILRRFLKILPLSAPLPASYQIPPDCTLNGIFPSNDTSFPHPIRTFSISFAALAHC